MDTSEERGVRLWAPGRHTRRASMVMLASLVILITTLGSISQVVPGLADTIFPWSNNSANSSLIPAKSNGTPNTLPNSGPGVSLPPGTVQSGSESLPTISEVANASVPPHLSRTANGFVYRTSFGIYSFNQSNPFIFALSSISGIPLTRESFFFVASSTPLSPGTSNITTATDNHYEVEYQVLSGHVQVGSLTLRVDFSASVKPKFTIDFSKTASWNLGTFHIEWFTYTVSGWLKNSPNHSSDFRSIQDSLTLQNVTKAEVGPSSDPSLWTDWATTDWSDVPAATLSFGRTVTFAMAGIGHTVSFPSNLATIDPTQVASTTVNFATSYSTQRKVVSYGGTYYLFCYTGSDIVYMTSRDQVSWSDTFVAGGGTGYGGAIGYSFDLYQSGATVALTWLYYNSSAGGDRTTALYFVKGVLFQGDISWSNPVQVAHWSQPYSWPPSVAIGTDGTFWVGGIWQDSNLKYNIWIYKSTNGSTFSLSTNYYTSSNASRQEALQLLPLPQGKLMALSSHYNDQTIRWTIWNPTSPTGPNWSSLQTSNVNLPANTVKWNLMSAATTPDGFVHLLFEQHTTSYQIVWDYYNSTSGQWTLGPTIASCSSQCLYPSITSDSLGNLYAFWMSLSSGVPTYLMYSTRLKAQSWSTASQPFGTGTGITNAIWLSAARTANKEVILAWTLNTTSPYRLFFGSLPLPSGVASGPPSQPWNKLGLSPYEQYLTQNGEYISPENGLLTVSQSDISVQGRNGETLAITRVYAQPFTFLQGNPFNYETSPYANLGNGWQLNFPWVGPQYAHFLNGEVFPIVYSTYATTTNSTYAVTVWSFENHQTEDFLFARTNTTNLSSHISTITFTLTTKDGTIYNFNSGGRITSMTDRTGQNAIAFNYTGSLLTSISDTVGRTATLKYNASNLLANVTYGGQTVRYGYSGSDLSTVTDAVGRAISLKYSSSNSWLLTGVVYVAGGNSTYTYGSAPIGTDALNYYVTLQNVYVPGSIVKTSSFSYNITDGVIAGTSVKQSDGSSVQGYTNYLFNVRSSSLTRTVLNATLVQMLKDQFWYDPVTGRSVQQDTYSGTSLTRSFYNSKFYDLWGNVIYTRDNTGHESYSSFGNTDSQYMFQSPGGLTTNTNGKVFYDDFNGPSLNTTAWVQGGSGTNRATTVSNSFLKLTAASSSQGTWQSNWIRSVGTYGYPFYAEVQMENWFGPGTSTISANLYISPTAVASNGNPSDSSNYLRISLQDLPSYNIYDRVSGGSQNSLWTNTDTGTQSVSWKIVLTDRNTLSVYLNRGYSVGYNLEYSTASLGLSTSFTPSYVYLSFANLNTSPYPATFDYVGLSTSNSVTVTNLQAGQKVELYDWNNVFQTSGTVASGQTSVTLDATQLPFPYGYLKIYELDGRTVQFTSPTREIWGGSTYSYTRPFRSGGVARTATGFLQSTTDYVDDALPAGATAYSDGGDAWVWATSSLAPVVSGSQSHVGFAASGTHEHYFNGSTTTLSATSGSYLIQYVYIPITSVPTEIMLQFHAVGGSWEHRAYWGGNLITACGTTGSTCGTNGTPSRLSMGPIPSVRNGWVELIVKTDDVGVNGLSINGWAYTLYNGGAYWDYSALGTPSTGTLTIPNLLAGQKAELDNSQGSLVVSATVATGQTSVSLNMYSSAIDIFPYSGYLKVYTISGALQYSSPLMTDIWGGDSYSYNQPVFTNSFNPGPVGSSIHYALIGVAQYQNATSSPEEGYSKYDTLGNPVQDNQMHNGSPFSTTNTYDSYGNKLSTINPANEKTYYSYSVTYQHAYLTNETQIQTSSMNVTTSFSYDFTSGMKISIIDPMGNRTDLQYDAIDRVVVYKQQAINGTRTEIDTTYQDSQDNLYAKNQKGNFTLFNYDGQGRTSSIKSYNSSLTSPVIVSENATYDWQNSEKSITTPGGNMTTYIHDYLGRLTKTTNPDGTYKKVSYNDGTLIESDFDESGHRTDYLYDSLHRLIGVRQYYSFTAYYLTTYFYDGPGNLVKVVDPNGQTTTYTYDDLNRVILTKYPDNYNETRTYDNIGNLVSKKDPNGHTIQYSYDALNRLTNETYPDGSKASYTYDRNGNRLSLSYLGNSATFKYDSRNRETSEIWTITGSQYTLRYSYDSAGNVVAITYPDGTTISYNIDPLNRISSVTNGATILATFNYAKNGLVGSITYGNGVQTNYIYDNRNRTSRIRTSQGTSTVLDLNYTYDVTGNVIGINTESYSYDFLSRLTNSTGPWGTIQYGYDGIGNRVWIKQGTTNTTYTYGAFYRLASSGSTTYTYDNNGNRLTLVSGGTTTRYNYDFENRLTSVAQGASTLGNYTYSPLGQRIQKLESGATTTFLNADVNVLYEKTGSTVGDYIYGTGLLAKLFGGSVYFFHTDLLGSVRLVTTGSSTIFSSNFEPFGPQYGATGSDPTYKYTSKPQDPSTGLYYYGARYYDSSIGRFISRDSALQSSIDPQRQCMYAYARNNPERYTDPTGACIKGIDLSLGIVFFLLGALGLLWTRAAFGVDLFVGFAVFLYFNFLPRAAYHLISGNIGAFLTQDLPRIAVWVIGQLFQRANWWQAFGIAAASAQAGTPLFWLNLGVSVAFFLGTTVAPLLAPPVGVCEWISAPTPAPPPPSPPPTSSCASCGSNLTCLRNC